MPALNPYLASMPAGYLFREVAKRIDDYQRTHPEDKVISLGIGDVTRPLSAAVTRAMASAALEMGTKEGFRGYGPVRRKTALCRRCRSTMWMRFTCAFPTIPRARP